MNHAFAMPFLELKLDPQKLRGPNNYTLSYHSQPTVLSLANLFNKGCVLR